MIRAIIFDFFDVIHADPYHAWMRNHGLKNEGEHAAANTATDLDEITMQEYFNIAAKAAGQTAAEMEAEYKAASEVDYGVVDILTRLKLKYHIALISDAPSKFLRDIISEYQLEDRFHHIVISGEVGLVKPDPRIFEHALKSLDVKAEEAVFVDDNPKNIAGAKAIGMQGIVFSTAELLKDSLEDLGVRL